MEKVMQLKTIKEYNDYMGVETRHPLVSVIEGSRMPHPVPHARKHVGMYVIFRKKILVFVLIYRNLCIFATAKRK